MIAGAVLFVIYPLFFVVLFTNLESWLWRIIWAVLFVASLWFPPFKVVYSVVMIIGIPVADKILDVNSRLN